MRPATVEETQSPPPLPPRATAAVGDWREFAFYLARKQAISGDLLGLANETRGNHALRALWGITDLSSTEFADEIARFYELPRAELSHLLAASSLVTQFSQRFLREASVFPCILPGSDDIILAVADPTDRTTIRAAELALAKPVQLAVASFEDVATVLSERLREDEFVEANAKLGPGARDNDIENLRDLASGAPVVRAVNDLLELAAESRATDIHIEPNRTDLVVRLRVDGVLRVLAIPPNVPSQAMLSRIKILAGLNIAERRLPQDGAAHMQIARSELDVRVATMPTQYGESAVIRLLPKDRGSVEIAKLGLSNQDQARVDRLLTLPHGMIAVTGPTGSGKTTTLASMLTRLNDSTRKIVTIEDPIEYELRGINQSQVKPDIGLTFASALRAFVRQDPDVIMVGEVRDRETANVAIHAALTGHLVLTTLHTDSAAAAVPRLLDLGVEGFLLQSTLRAVIAQRLVRVLCERCKRTEVIVAADIANDPRHAMFGLGVGDVVHEPMGCEHCGGTGYRGRTGIFEVLEITDDIRSLVGARAEAQLLMQAARRAKMVTMFEHGVAKCRAGMTSMAEILRVTVAS